MFPARTELRNLKALVFIVCCIFLGNHTRIWGQEELDVFPYWSHLNQGDDAFYQHYVSRARSFLDERTARLGAVDNRRAAMAYRDTVMSKLRQAFSPFPARTPLNPTVTGTIEKEGYIIEKFYFESRPSYYVTAALFIPRTRQEPAPAIVYCSGHSDLGFRSDTYQHIILNYVAKGFVVLAFDPIGQGERFQYFDASGERRFGPTQEHSYPGTQAFIAGISPANFLIWDGIRAIDYLMTREEIDPDRIGIAGRSGGGTQSAYIAAVDSRIVAAAPECYLTTFEYLLQSKGPQDAEQNLFHGIAEGLDHADYLIARAPKPTLMVTTTRDIFSIEGARNVFAEAKNIYELMGEPANMTKVEDDAGHASTRKNREASYAFFQQYLNNPGSSADMKVELFAPEELWVTKNGNVFHDLGGEDMHSLVQGVMKDVENNRSDYSFPELLEKLVEHTGYESPGDDVEIVFSGRIQKDFYAIERYLVQGAGDYYFPLLWLIPENHIGSTVLILDDGGKRHLYEEGNLVERFLSRGFQVLAPDLSGFGEMGSGLDQGDAVIDGVTLNLWYAGILTAKSLSAIRMQEIAHVFSFLVDGKVDLLVARGLLCAEALQYLFMDNRANTLVLDEPLFSNESIVNERNYDPAFAMHTAAGAIRDFDLSDLLIKLPLQKIVVINPVNARNERLDSSTVRKVFQPIALRREEQNLGDLFYEIISDPGYDLTKWLQN